MTGPAVAQRSLVGLAVLMSLTLSGCGGGSDATTTANTTATITADSSTASSVGPLGERARALSVTSTVDSSTSIKYVTGAEAAKRLFEFAETAFPLYFPSHQTTATFSPYLYRYYPETGIYLGVADEQVYVLGGEFGPTVTPVGPVSKFVDLTPDPTASLAAPSSGKTPWNLATAAKFEMRDGRGALMSGTKSCVSDEPVALTVSADCSSMTGHRLGQHAVTVTLGKYSAKASVKVVPQAQPLGHVGVTDSSGLVATADGAALTWGKNDYGHQGQGATVTTLGTPTLVSGVTGVVAVATGQSTSLALTEDGEVLSWGRNNAGQLGRFSSPGTPLTSPTPGKVLSPNGQSTLQHIVSIAVGINNAVALADDGRVFTWGSYNGQADSAGAVPLPNVITPVPGETNTPSAVAVYAAYDWSAALLADGRVVSWGYRNGTTGSLGRVAGVPASNYLPGYVVQAAGGAPLTDIVAMSIGREHALAIDSTGKTWAWGNNVYGQLGTGFTSAASTFATPVKGPDGVNLLSDVTMVAAGGNHSMALDKSGRVYTWGWNVRGQLGAGPNQSSTIFRPLPALTIGTETSAPLTSVATIAAGYMNSVALLSDGQYLIWGDGASNLLAQGINSLTSSPTPLTVPLGTGTLQLGPMSTWPNLTRRAR